MVLEKLDKRGGRLYYVEVSGSLNFLSVVAARAETEGVQIVKGSDFYGSDFYADGSGRSSMRLAFSFPGVEEIQEGCRRLGAALRRGA